MTLHAFVNMLTNYTEAYLVILNSLPENPHLADVFKVYPKGVRPLLEFHDAILRGESALTIGERELIAAFVSGLNNCNFCFNAHQKLAVDFGIESSLLESLLDDIDNSNIEDTFKPILRYVKKLTLTPTKLIQEDIDSILAAGHQGDIIYDAVIICGLFNLMNRIVEGMGVVQGSSIMSEKPNKVSNYLDFGRMIGVI